MADNSKKVGVLKSDVPNSTIAFPMNTSPSANCAMRRRERVVAPCNSSTQREAEIRSVSAKALAGKEVLALPFVILRQRRSPRTSAMAGTLLVQIDRSLNASCSSVNRLG